MITTSIDKSKGEALVKEGDAWAEIARRASAFVVVDDASAETAAEMVKKARAVLREKEEERKTITVPLLAAKNAVDALFRPAKDAIESIISHYKSEIGRYHAERERARVAVLVQSAAEISQGIVPTEPIPEPVHVPKTTIRQTWDFEIIDADAVPREYCSPDDTKIKAAIWYADTKTPPREIPGLRFFQKETVTVR
jgi:hypothetical protein